MTCACAVRKELAEGKPVMLADGRTIDSEDVLGPPGGRKKLVIVGDTETIEDLADHVRDADVLVIEATFLNRDAAIARDYGHLTAAEAAMLAAMSNVKILVLTHISGRYPDEEILAEATKIFPNSGRGGAAGLCSRAANKQRVLLWGDLTGCTS